MGAYILVFFGQAYNVHCSGGAIATKTGTNILLFAKLKAGDFIVVEGA
jgi:hypothetical protein